MRQDSDNFAAGYCKPVFVVVPKITAGQRRGEMKLRSGMNTAYEPRVIGQK
jgi:hypothetical protein